MMGRPRRSPLFPYTPLSRPPGCVFAPRCEFRRAICVENEPPLFPVPERGGVSRSEEHTSELQSHSDLVCRLLLEKKKKLPCPFPSRLRGRRLRLRAGSTYGR